MGDSASTARRYWSVGSTQPAARLNASMRLFAGIATISINVVGHGGGALGTLNVIPKSGAPVVVPAGGRGFDQDGNGTIDSTEGVSAPGLRSIISSRDGLRQTVAWYRSAALHGAR